jgi:hypothetical protein
MNALALRTMSETWMDRDDRKSNGKILQECAAALNGLPPEIAKDDLVALLQWLLLNIKKIRTN